MSKPCYLSEAHVTNFETPAMENYVFVIDTNQKPLNPVHPARARELLTKGRAAVFRTYPFVIILHHAVEVEIIPEWELKIDQGSKTSGFALVRNNQVFWGLNNVLTVAKKISRSR